MLWQVARHLLETAKTLKTGSLLQLQASAVFHAFTFEAYLNHVGSQEIKSWEENERIQYREKLSDLSRHLNFKFDPGRRPFQTIWVLFELRNNLAHGKTIEIKHEFSTSQEIPDDSAWLIPAGEYKPTCPHSLIRFDVCGRDAPVGLNESFDVNFGANSDRSRPPPQSQ